MTDAPHVSVIVPTYERPQALRRCLRALARQTYPSARYDAVVVDDGGTADLAPLLAEMRSRLRVTLVRQANAGPARARNTGAERASGTHLAFTDDDCAPAPDWLSRLAAAAAEAPRALLGGRTVNALPHNPFSTVSQQLVSFLYEQAAEQRRPPFFTSNNIALPADLFFATGGFDARYPRAAGEDRAFCDEWRAAGHRLRYVPEAVVHHAHPLTLRSFWRQHFNYGRGAFAFHRQRETPRTGRLAPEPLAFYARLLRYPLGQHPGLKGLHHAALMLLAQGANAAGFFREKAAG